MRSTCIIGNSHVACVKAAVDKNNWDASLGRLTFFGAGGGGLLSHLTLKGQRIVPTNERTVHWFKLTSNGHSYIDCSAYDNFVIVGAGLGLFRYFRSARHHAPYSLYSRYKRPQLVSEDCFKTLRGSIIANTNAIRIGNFLSLLKQPRVLILPEPCRNERILSQNQDMSAMAEGGVISALYEWFLQDASSAVTDLGFDFRPQPEDSLSRPGFTKAEFGSKGVGFKNRMKPLPKNEMTHMNEQYGSILLGLIADFISSQSEDDKGQEASIA